MRRENALLRQIAEREFGNGLMLDRPHNQSNIESQSANSPSNPRGSRFEARGSSCSILRPILLEQASMSEVVAQLVLETLSAVWEWRNVAH